MKSSDFSKALILAAGLTFCHDTLAKNSFIGSDEAACSAIKSAQGIDSKATFEDFRAALYSSNEDLLRNQDDFLSEINLAHRWPGTELLEMTPQGVEDLRAQQNAACLISKINSDSVLKSILTNLVTPVDDDDYDYGAPISAAPAPDSENFYQIIDALGLNPIENQIQDFNDLIISIVVVRNSASGAPIGYALVIDEAEPEDFTFDSNKGHQPPGQYEGPGQLVSKFIDPNSFNPTYPTQKLSKDRYFRLSPIATGPTLYFDAAGKLLDQ